MKGCVLNWGLTLAMSPQEHILRSISILTARCGMKNKMEVKWREVDFITKNVINYNIGENIQHEVVNVGKRSMAWWSTYPKHHHIDDYLSILCVLPLCSGLPIDYCIRTVWAKHTL